MFSDVTVANCSVPESPIHVRDEEDLIHGEYTAGSVVWARLTGWPWWPAMVDDDPDTEQYYWLDGFSDIPVKLLLNTSYANVNKRPSLMLFADK